MLGANNLPTTVEMNISQHYLTMGAKCFSDSTTIDCFSFSSFFSIFLNIKHYVATINQEFIVLSYDPEDFMHDNLTEPSLMKYTHFTLCSWSYLQICLILYYA